MARRALTPDQYPAFREAARTLGDRRLGQAFGLGETTARRWRVRLGVERPALPTNPYQPTAAQEEAIAARWGRETQATIATEVGLCVSTVRKVARARGLPGYSRALSAHRYGPERVAAFLADVADPSRTVAEVAAAHGVHRRAAYQLRRRFAPHLLRPVGNRFLGARYHPMGGDKLSGARLRKAALMADKTALAWRCWACGRLVRTTVVCDCGAVAGWAA